MVQVVWNSLLLILALQFTGLTDYCSGYWFVWPLVVSVAVSLVVAVLGARAGPERTLLLWVLSVLQLSLPVWSWLAIHLWPGGDDGPGLGWGLGIVPLSWVGCALGVVNLVLACSTARRAGHQGGA